MNTENIYKFPRIEGTNFYGSIDKLEIRNGVAILIGWIFNTDSRAPVTVRVSSSSGTIGRKIADEIRPDVLSAGAPSEDVGFQIPLKSTGEESQISIHVSQSGKEYLFKTVKLGQKLPCQGLTSDDVAAVFRLVFLREPENNHAITNQLEHHSNKASLFAALFNSPEFYEKHPSLIKLLHEKKFR